MAYRKSSFVYNREVTKTGVASYEDVYSIIRDNVDNEVEFYEIEPAIVTEVYLEPKDLPSIGNIPDYSKYGTIKARFLYSQDEDDEIAEFINPLSSHMVVYPLVGEIVNVASYGGQMYYYSPLNLGNDVNMNRATGVRPDGSVKLNITKYNRLLASKKGDININGRFGQGIKFSSNGDYRFPTIKITNGQNNDRRKFANEKFPHIQNINLDGSTILISSGELKTKNDILIPAANSSWWPVKWKTSIEGNVIMLNSDSLVFNAKANDGDIHLFATRNIGLSSNYSITLEPGDEGVINLGEADATNPVLKGKETQDLFEKIFVALSEFSNTLKNVQGTAEINDAAELMFDKVKNIEDVALPKIFSKTVYIVDEKD
tara:strand:+ start:849 stop:1967 length:1119 start_codon:yes stop_codon:yes gene_type:complete